MVDHPLPRGIRPLDRRCQRGGYGGRHQILGVRHPPGHPHAGPAEEFDDDRADDQPRRHSQHPVQPAQAGKRQGLVQKTRERGGKTFAYSVTPLGEKVTDDYASLRSELLIESLKSIASLDDRLTDTTQFMSVLTGIYEEMSRSSATFTHTS